MRDGAPAPSMGEQNGRWGKLSGTGLILRRKVGEIRRVGRVRQSGSGQNYNRKPYRIFHVGIYYNYKVKCGPGRLRRRENLLYRSGFLWYPNNKCLRPVRGMRRFFAARPERIVTVFMK